MGEGLSYVYRIGDLYLANHHHIRWLKFQTFVFWVIAILMLTSTLSCHTNAFSVMITSIKKITVPYWQNYFFLRQNLFQRQKILIKQEPVKKVEGKRKWREEKWNCSWARDHANLRVCFGVRRGISVAWIPRFVTSGRLSPWLGRGGETATTCWAATAPGNTEKGH